MPDYDDNTTVDPAEDSAARAISEFLTALDEQGDVSPEAYLPSNPQATPIFWKAVSGLESLVGRSGRAPKRAAAPLAEGAVPKIDGYTIEHRIGQGGMGVVFQALQHEPNRRVALKLVTPQAHLDAYHSKLLRREAGVLARLKHPSIAAIHEVGKTAQGQHFFAMELVHGKPLDTYIRDARLSREAIIDLFLNICDAIAYAHQRGVIHRDLKPSNILVDDHGVPHVLDFGMARVTDVDVGLSTLVAEVGKIHGTLRYMSPEQTLGNPNDVDVRTDVYSLGIILYELLTGQSPYDVTREQPYESLRVICEQMPPRPSVINKELTGDLETILLKALEKDPERRFGSVTALADDLRRHASDQPILARPASRVYLVKKFVKRHRLLSVLVSSLLLSLIAFATTSALMVQRIAKENRRVNQSHRRGTMATVTFQRLISEIIDAGNSPQAIRDVLDRQVSIAQHEFADQPAVIAELQAFFGTVYHNIGQHQDAVRHARDALTMCRDRFGNDNGKTLYATTMLAHYLIHTEQLQEAYEQILSAVDIQTQPVDLDYRSVIGDNLLLLARAYDAEGQFARAESLVRLALDHYRAASSQQACAMAYAQGLLGKVLLGQDPSQGLTLIETNHGVLLEHLGPDHPHVLQLGHWLVQALELAGESDKAKALQQMMPTATSESTCRLAMSPADFWAWTFLGMTEQSGLCATGSH